MPATNLPACSMVTRLEIFWCFWCCSFSVCIKTCWKSSNLFFFLTLSQRSQLHLRQLLTAATRSHQVCNTEHILLILEQSSAHIKYFYDVSCCLKEYFSLVCLILIWTTVQLNSSKRAFILHAFLAEPCFSIRWSVTHSSAQMSEVWLPLM